jgi:hypothetical protein
MGFISAIATYAARAVKNGRGICGQTNSKDVLSPLAQRDRGFTVGLLPEPRLMADKVFATALTDNAFTPVLDQVAFRHDFALWRRRLSRRDRRIMHDLMIGERTQTVSRKYGISEARVSQLRRELKQSWNVFCDEAPVPPDRHQGNVRPTLAIA